MDRNRVTGSGQSRGRRRSRTAEGTNIYMHLYMWILVQCSSSMPLMCELLTMLALQGKLQKHSFKTSASLADVDPRGQDAKLHTPAVSEFFYPVVVEFHPLQGRPCRPSGGPAIAQVKRVLGMPAAA